MKNQQKLYQVKNLSTDDEIVRKSSESVNFKGSNYYFTYYYFLLIFSGKYNSSSNIIKAFEMYTC